ncbi:hypothetical protein L9F63_023115, partial [Diploptera punctata]
AHSFMLMLIATKFCMKFKTFCFRLLLKLKLEKCVFQMMISIWIFIGIVPASKKKNIELMFSCEILKHNTVIVPLLWQLLNEIQSMKTLLALILFEYTVVGVLLLIHQSLGPESKRMHATGMRLFTLHQSFSFVVARLCLYLGQPLKNGVNRISKVTM